MENGEQCVTISGITWMPVWSVTNLGSQVQVSNVYIQCCFAADEDLNKTFQWPIIMLTSIVLQYVGSKKNLVPESCVHV